MFLSEDSKEFLKLLEERRYAKAHAWLNRVCLLQLDGETAGECLTQALHATPHLFRKVLSRCTPKEHSGQITFRLTDKKFVSVRGTLLVLAAALNKPEHVKILLSHGYDPNSAGVESAAAFDRMAFFISNKASTYGDRCGVGGGYLVVSGKGGWSIHNITPLAAAVACGSREAAAVLLRCPEVWKAESGVVCRAAVSALELFAGDPRQELAGMVFGKTRGKVFYPQDLMRTCDLQIEHSSDFCSYDLLETQIKFGLCDDNAARSALRLFEKNTQFNRSVVRARIRKMSLLVKSFPVVGRESWVTGLFLRELVRRYSPEKPHVQLMKQWKRLCEGEGDLTWAVGELYRMNRPNLQQLLQALGEDTTLVMDADAFSLFGKEAKGELMDLLTHVELRHNRGLNGISALTATLLRHTDLRYLRKAAKCGAFGGEDPEELLKVLDRKGCSHLRGLILTYSGQPKDASEPRWKHESRSALWHREWELSPTEYETWLQNLISDELEEEECLRRLQMMHYAAPDREFWQRDCYIELSLPEGRQRDRVFVADPEAALCCGVQQQPLQLLLQYMPEMANRCYALDFRDSDLMNLEGSLLTLAAATGQVELVKVLLDAGLDPDETGHGCVSSLRSIGHMPLPVTPVMAAIYYGEEETAKLLLEHGAKCDCNKPLFRRLIECGNEKMLQVVSNLPNMGFEQIPTEWLACGQPEKQLF